MLIYVDKLSLFKRRLLQLVWGVPVVQGGSLAREFLDEFPKIRSSLIQVGRGGHGIVFLRPTDQNMVFKVSKQKGTCYEWDSEFKMITNIHKAFEKQKIEQLKYAEVIKVKDYAQNTDMCVFCMDYIQHTPDVNMTIVPNFGKESINVEYNGRGLYLGLKEMRKYISPEEILIYAEQLGKIMGYLHYIAEVDGNDIEVIYGHKASDPDKNKLFVIDFDRVGTIDFAKAKTDAFYRHEVINSMEWVLLAMPYFPVPNVGDLYPKFKTGYLSVAQMISNISIAEEVLSYYEKDSV